MIVWVLPVCCLDFSEKNWFINNYKCSSFISAAVIIYPYKKQLREERGLFQLTIPGCGKIKAGTSNNESYHICSQEKREMKMYVFVLSFMSPLLCSSGPISYVLVLPTLGWILRQSLTDTPKGQLNVDINWLSFQVIQGCVKLKMKANVIRKINVTWWKEVKPVIKRS